MVSSATARVAQGLVENVASVVLGKRQHVVAVIAGLLAGGHVLVEDVPGVGKTLLAKSLAISLGGQASRVQGTSDLMPTDITGVSIYDPGKRNWEFHPGPIFHNVVLIDEMNRATPRAQSALLEAMAEGQVTVDGTAHRLPTPFFVIATQNPLGDIGTFPLAEGQCDRFAMVVSLGLPGREAERAILRGEGGAATLETLKPVVNTEELASAMSEVDGAYVHAAVSDYLLDIIDATRAQPGLDHGASPRAARAMLQVAKAYAVLAGRAFVSPDDVKAVAAPVLAHRLGAGSTMGSEGARRLVADILASVPAPAA